MEFYSKLTPEEIEQRLAETAMPMPKFGFSPYHQILYRRQKQGRLTLCFKRGFLQYVYFNTELKAQKDGTLISGKFCPFADFHPVLSTLSGIIFVGCVMAFDYFFLSHEIPYYGLSPVLTIPLCVIIFLFSQKERVALTEYIQNNLLE